MEISNTLKNGINGVWNAIANDVCVAALECGDEMTNEIAIELCVDADRLSTFGYKSADAELEALVKEHGYDKVFKALCQQISLF